jgi:hypothetical protein
MTLLCGAVGFRDVAPCRTTANLPTVANGTTLTLRRSGCRSLSHLDDNLPSGADRH